MEPLLLLQCDVKSALITSSCLPVHLSADVRRGDGDGRGLQEPAQTEGGHFQTGERRRLSGQPRRPVEPGHRYGAHSETGERETQGGFFPNLKYQTVKTFVAPCNHKRFIANYGCHDITFSLHDYHDQKNSQSRYYCNMCREFGGKKSNLSLT